MIRVVLGDKAIRLHAEIAVPKDENLVLQLYAKLYEYRQRLLLPNLDPHKATSTHFKIWVLQQLLDQKHVAYERLKAEVAKDQDDDTLSMAYFAYAWKVIENYCLYSGQGNHGGTGLPDYWAALESGVREASG